ncbi:hypothetical protein [Loktanella sp. S4079]|uniref:hypothetical protein n=1 Tax=Loktanella sp. S4079 TaxID=579483 RepID=UPI0005F9E4F0|nr:hypothetical protein [Loktanella sp. S4079]KJZ19159.1 hypothetical protein TW80_10175 [Loktanella sp. S4079]
MSNQNLSTRVQEELKQAVESGLLPIAVKRRAQQILGRLSQPVRVGLLGMPDAGKSKILNLLVGADVIPDGVELPTIQLTYGDTPQAILTLEDDDKLTLDTADFAEITSHKPIFIDLRMPLAALKKISVLEVNSPADPDALYTASQWAAKRCDVAMWCTKGFLPAEQNIWAHMPDLIKDHGFLMLTHADKIIAAGKLDIAMTAVRKAAGDDFNHVLPIATNEALASRKPDGTVNKDLMRSSGGLALIAAVLKQVDQGRQSAVDRGDILLHQNADIISGKVKAVDDQEVKKETETTDTAATTVTLSVVHNDTVSEKETSKLVSRTIIGDDETPEVVTLQPSTRNTYETALGYIAERSQELLEMSEVAGEDAPAQLIAATAEHVQWICDYLNENGDDSDQALVRARETAFDAADLAQLMQMEKNDNAVIEALSLLLQIKHELQADLAA